MKQNTSWQNVASWYSKLTKDEGHYFHQNLIIPKTLELLSLKEGNSVLDIGCGQGVLTRTLPKSIYYQGIDISPSLIDYAKKHDGNNLHHYIVANATLPFPIGKKDFTHAVVILALQNIENPEAVLKNISLFLAQKSKLVLVINHPYFRIPKQTAWGIDEKNGIQYRRVNRYLSPLKIPINMHPGEKNPELTWSFHYPLSSYSEFLQKAGFVIEKIEEWVSPKNSVGKAAKMENMARAEFPLFMAILARKNY